MLHNLDAEHSNFAMVCSGFREVLTLISRYHFQGTDLNYFSHHCPYLYPRTKKARVFGIRELNRRLGQVIECPTCWPMYLCTILRSKALFKQ